MEGNLSFRIARRAEKARAVFHTAPSALRGTAASALVECPSALYDLAWQKNTSDRQQADR
jgi:hypothetical protein